MNVFVEFKYSNIIDVRFVTFMLKWKTQNLFMFEQHRHYSLNFILEDRLSHP